MGCQCWPPAPSSDNEEVAGLLFTTGTPCFFLGTILKVNTNSVEEAALFGMSLNCVSKLLKREEMGKLVIIKLLQTKLLSL